MEKIYTAIMINTGGRRGGQSVSPDGSFIVDIAQPRELSGKETSATNPEQLFAAGYSACFNGAVNAVLRDAGVKYETSHVTVAVHLLKDPEQGYFIAVDIKVAIDDFSQEDNQKWADLAHQRCPYSKAIRGNAAVTVTGA
jgi:lipoyl-dependent peroxiredoxin